MKLYSYYRSTAAYRVRIALNYKSIDHTIIPVNLIDDEQHHSTYKQHNPQARVPTLDTGEIQFGQSLAILEYLEETYPTPPLLPESPDERAYVRYISQIIACDMHPLNNVGTIKYLKEHLHHTQEEAMQWYFHWLKTGFTALENIIKENSYQGKCCLGDSITIADVCLIPQIYNAFRFKFSMDNYPTLMAINEYCTSLPYVVNASPEKQPDHVA